MPVGDCEKEVQAAATADGIPLTPMPRVPWLNTRGHFALPPRAAEAVPLLQRALELLAGDAAEQQSKALLNPNGPRTS